MFVLLGYPPMAQFALRVGNTNAVVLLFSTKTLWREIQKQLLRRNTQFQVKVEQIRSPNLLQRLDEYVNERKGSKVEALEEEEVESSVLFSNHSQTIMLPQLSPSLTNTKNTLQPTSSLAYLRPASL